MSNFLTKGYEPLMPIHHSYLEIETSALEDEEIANLYYINKALYLITRKERQEHHKLINKQEKEVYFEELEEEIKNNLQKKGHISFYYKKEKITDDFQSDKKTIEQLGNINLFDFDYVHFRKFIE